MRYVPAIAWRSRGKLQKTCQVIGDLNSGSPEYKTRGDKHLTVTFDLLYAATLLSQEQYSLFLTSDRLSYTSNYMHGYLTP